MNTYEAKTNGNYLFLKTKPISQTDYALEQEYREKDGVVYNNFQVTDLSYDYLL